MSPRPNSLAATRPLKLSSRRALPNINKLVRTLQYEGFLGEYDLSGLSPFDQVQSLRAFANMARAHRPAFADGPVDLKMASAERHAERTDTLATYGRHDGRPTVSLYRPLKPFQDFYMCVVHELYHHFYPQLPIEGQLMAWTGRTRETLRYWRSPVGRGVGPDADAIAEIISEHATTSPNELATWMSERGKMAAVRRSGKRSSLHRDVTAVHELFLGTDRSWRKHAEEWLSEDRRSVPVLDSEPIWITEEGAIGVRVGADREFAPPVNHNVAHYIRTARGHLYRDEVNATYDVIASARQGVLVTVDRERQFPFRGLGGFVNHADSPNPDIITEVVAVNTLFDFPVGKAKFLMSTVAEAERPLFAARVLQLRQLDCDVENAGGALFVSGAREQLALLPSSPWTQMVTRGNAKQSIRADLGHLVCLPDGTEVVDEALWNCVRNLEITKWELPDGTIFEEDPACEVTWYERPPLNTDAVARIAQEPEVALREALTDYRAAERAFSNYWGAGNHSLR